MSGRRGERLVVDETAPHRRLPLSLHRQIARKARTLGPGAALIFARQHSAGERRIGDQADALLPAYLRQFVRETAVVEAEIILDRLVASQPQPLGCAERLHQTPPRFVRTADNADRSAARRVGKEWCSTVRT